MYIQRINRKQNGKVYTSIILTESYRENGKQKRRTLAVLTKWPKHLVVAIEAALKNKAATIEVIEGVRVFDLLNV